MAKVSIDVEEIKKSLKETAMTARTQLAELAKKAQKDLSQTEVLKKIDQVVAIVKSQELMKNPKVQELAKKIVSLSEQLEKTVTKGAHQWANQVRTTVTKATGTDGKAKKAATNGHATSSKKKTKAKFPIARTKGARV